MTDYLGYPVLEDRPNAAEPRDTLWARKMFRLDPGTGAVDVRDRAGLAIPDHGGFAWQLNGRAEIAAFRAWLAARRGRLNPFWAPTWRRDLVLKQLAAANDSVLVIEKCGYSEHVFPSHARRHLMIGLPGAASGWGDGGWGTMPWGGGPAGAQFRRVLAAAENAGDETLMLDAPLGADVPLETLICYLALVRLASDDIELTWHTSQLVTAVADFSEVPGDPLQVPLLSTMLSQSGLTAFDAALTVNGVFPDLAWHTDAAAAGATLTADLGVPWSVRRAAIYAVGAGYAGRYSVRYSDDGSQWFAARTGFIPANAGRNDALWAERGAHRWWQLYLENTPGPGPWLSELQFYTR